MSHDGYTSVARNSLPTLQYRYALIPILPTLFQRAPPFYLPPKPSGISHQNQKTHFQYGLANYALGNRVAYNTRQMPPLPKARVVEKLLSTSCVFLLWIYAQISTSVAY